MNKFFLLLPLVMLAGCVESVEEHRARIVKYQWANCEQSSKFLSPRQIYECFKLFEKEEKTK
jgi:hypothetical protein